MVIKNKKAHKFCYILVDHDWQVQGFWRNVKTMRHDNFSKQVLPFLFFLPLIPSILDPPCWGFLFVTIENIRFSEAEIGDIINATIFQEKQLVSPEVS